MPNVYYTEPALLDLDKIHRTYARYAQASADERINGLSDTFELIAQMPLMGRARDDLLPGIRMHVYKGHVIFYSLLEDGIMIERLASPGQDPNRFFG